jgi:hypothetical protein
MMMISLTLADTFNWIIYERGMGCAAVCNASCEVLRILPVISHDIGIEGRIPVEVCCIIGHVLQQIKALRAL